MKKLKLFWKTWMITMGILVTTNALLVVTYAFFVVHSYNQSQQEHLNKSFNNIEKHLVQFGLDEPYLAAQSKQGLIVNLSKDGVYTYIQEEVYFEIPEAYAADLDSMVFEDNQNTLTNYGDIEIGGEVYKLEVSVFLFFSQNNVYHSVKQVTPFFLILGISISGLVSAIYANYFTKRVKRINNAIDCMKNLEYEVPDIMEYDELAELNESINQMYKKLKGTLIKLENENGRVKQLQNERLLYTRGITHELKTPIMAVMSILEGMRYNVHGFEDTDKYLEICYEQMNGMSRLVKELLETDFCSQSVSVELVSVNPLITSIVELHQNLATERELVVKIEDNGLFRLPISESNVRKVLSNLIGNAVKYADPQTEIIIRTGDHSFCIENDTILLNKENLPYLGRAFYTANDESTGHGLGLYFVTSLLCKAKIKYEIALVNNVFRFCIMK